MWLVDILYDTTVYSIKLYTINTFHAASHFNGYYVVTALRDKPLKWLPLCGGLYSLVSCSYASYSLYVEALL